MLIALSCSCHGSIPLIRQFLSSQHHPDPFSVKILQDADAKGWVNKNNLSDIQAYLAMRNSYAIIAGWGRDKKVHWADINNQNAQQQLKAQAIVERFGQS